MHVTTTTDEWDLESIPSSELASLVSPLTPTEDDHVIEMLPTADMSPPPEHERAAPLAASNQPSPGLVLDSFVPILNKIRSALSIEENEYHIVKDIDASEWKDLQEHARCVEELTFSDTAQPQVAASTFFRLGQLQGAHAPLFPALLKLHIANTTSAPIPYLELFFSPTLRAVSIKGIASSSKMTVASFLGKIGAQTRMAELVLDSVTMSPEIFAAIEKCTHLTSLELTNLTGALDYTALGTVAYLPHLESFRIDTKNVTQIHPLATAFPATPKYLSIKSFSFVGNFSALEGIISDLVDAPLLQSINIEVVKYDPVIPKGESKKATNTPIKKIIERIVSDRRHTSMTKFTFIMNQGLVAFPSELLQTLSKLQNLTHLDISGPNILDLDKTLCEVTTFWPKLTILKFPLIEMNNAKPADGLSMSTLSRIAKSCPDLRLFQGAIVIPNSAPSWSISDASNTPVMTHGLKSLVLGSVGNSQLNQMTPASLGLVHYVARCLYAMFPAAGLDDESRTLSKLHPAFWTQVFECIKLCREAREIDRCRENAGSTTDTSA